MTTNRSAQTGQQTGMLKTFLVVGSLVATLAGTRLLAARETAVVEAAVPADAAVTVVVPADTSAAANTSANSGASALPLPPTGGGTQIELKAIPQAVQPQIQPVARARSSR